MVAIQLPAGGSQETPKWSATYAGRALLTECSLGLKTASGGELLAGVHVAHEQERRHRGRIPMPFGKADHALDHHNELQLDLEGATGNRVSVTFRCFNDAVAFRYQLPAGTQAGTQVTVTEETSRFQPVGDPQLLVQYLENHRTSHEHTVAKVSWGSLRRDALLDMPLTLSWPDGTWAAITEASLRHYAGMALMRPGSGAEGGSLVSRLTPRTDDTKVVRPLPMDTPWRVVLIGSRAGALLESTTLYCLNDPPAIGDTSWIHPGKITFSWWNGDVYDGTPGEPILSVGMAKRYIDFCASHGLPIHSLTSTEGSVTPWYHQSNPGVVPGPDTDVTRPRPGFDLATIRDYAQSKGVRLWTWVHQAALRGRVEEAFAAFEKMGWSGMMVDFFDHDDQDSVEFAESVLVAAARHHILIHLHGVWKPTGWERTFPNLMNHEGALNQEYLKWSDLCTPDHNINMALTRLIAGPMDYHLGGFRAVPRSRFKPRNVAPNVLGTRAHQLALYVCYNNPAPMVADYPTAYEGQPGFEFLQRVPTWWDETRVPIAQPGELFLAARRKGDVWYVGCLSAGAARTVSVPLSFLGRGRWTARLWKDAAEAARDPNLLEIKTVPVGPRETLTVTTAPDGGFVAEIAPQQQ
jgi:alpha-glucosidase